MTPERTLRSTRRHGRIVKQKIDVERRVGLPVAALLCLLDEPHHRCVALGERCLVCEVGDGGGGQCQRGYGGRGERG